VAIWPADPASQPLLATEGECGLGKDWWEELCWKERPHLTGGLHYTEGLHYTTVLCSACVSTTVLFRTPVPVSFVWGGYMLVRLIGK
jgi:hypothetical protein